VKYSGKDVAHLIEGRGGKRENRKGCLGITTGGIRLLKIRREGSTKGELENWKKKIRGSGRESERKWWAAPALH